MRFKWFVLCIGILFAAGAGAGSLSWEAWLQRSLEEAGDPEFDLAFAIVAIEAGHPDQAVFALERVLLVQPWNHRARLELGRAHYLLGEYARAREAFAAVLAADPPPAVRRRARRWLAAIEDMQRSRRPDFRMEFGVAVGADSNVNVATSDERIRIPSLGEFLLSPAARRRADRFRELELAGDGRWPLDQRQALRLALRFSDRSNFSSSDYDLRVASLGLGWERRRGAQRWRVPLDVQWVQVGDRMWRRLALSGLEWSAQESGRPLQVAVRLGGQTYPGSPLRDNRLVLLQADTLARGPHGAPLALSLNLGSEFPRRGEGGSWARRYLGIRLGWRMPLSAGWRLSVRGDWQRSLYRKADPVFGVTRRETWKALELAGERRIDRRWSVRLRLELVDNDANIGFYSHERGQLSVSWRAVWP